MKEACFGGIKYQGIEMNLIAGKFVSYLWPLVQGSCLSGWRRRKGQTTVEYLLMLAVVVGMALIMGVLFHKRILGGLFTMVGMVIGAGKPSAAP